MASLSTLPDLETPPSVPPEARPEGRIPEAGSDDDSYP